MLSNNPPSSAPAFCAVALPVASHALTARCLDSQRLPAVAPAGVEEISAQPNVVHMATLARRMSSPQPNLTPPSGPCWKQKPTLRTWPLRYVRIEGKSLNVYNDEMLR